MRTLCAPTPPTPQTPRTGRADPGGGHDGGVGRGDRVRDDRGLVEGKIVGDGDEGVLAGDGVLGPAAVVVEAAGAHLGAGAAARAVLARPQVCPAARVTRVPTVRSRLGRVPRVWITPETSCPTVTAWRGRAKRGEGTVDQVDVREANAGGLDLDQHLARAGDGDGDLLYDGASCCPGGSAQQARCPR